jgi:hypothetical protein
VYLSPTTRLSRAHRNRLNPTGSGTAPQSVVHPLGTKAERASGGRGGGSSANARQNKLPIHHTVPPSGTQNKPPASGPHPLFHSTPATIHVRHCPTFNSAYISAIDRLKSPIARSSCFPLFHIQSSHTHNTTLLNSESNHTRAHDIKDGDHSHYVVLLLSSTCVLQSTVRYAVQKTPETRPR